MAAEDLNVWQTLLSGAGAVIATLTGGLWIVQSNRLEKCEDKLDGKVDAINCTRHQDSQNAIWTELRSLRQDVNDKHIELIQLIGSKK